MKSIALFGLTYLLPFITAQDASSDGVYCGVGHYRAKCFGFACCSRAGLCGYADEYCGKGCQVGYGKCYGVDEQVSLSSPDSGTDTDSLTADTYYAPMSSTTSDTASEPFCLKVVPAIGNVFSAYYLSSRGADSSLAFRPAHTTSYPPLLFTIQQSSGQLTTASGYAVRLAHPGRFISKLNYFYPEEKLGGEHPVLEKCSVDANGYLKCQAESGKFVLSTFVRIGEEIFPYFATGENLESEILAVNLKVLSGKDCPVD